MLTLKQPPKKRWLPWLMFFLLLIAAVAAPIRREYSTVIDARQCGNCGGEVLTTAVHYGAPMAWLTLSKSVNQTTHQTVKSSTIKDAAKLSLDLMLWGLIIAFYLLFKILGRLKSRSAKAT